MIITTITPENKPKTKPKMVLRQGHGEWWRGNKIMGPDALLIILALGKDSAIICDDSNDNGETLRIWY